MTTPAKIQPLRLADAESSVYHVFVRDLELSAEIGVHRHERRRSQPVRINIDLRVGESEAPVADRLENVLDYEVLVSGVKDIVARGHIRLVETLAEMVAMMCLADPRVHSARVRVEKLNVVPEAASVGVEIERTRPGR